MHAVKVRQRLGSGGNGGIPLWSELKSLLGVVVIPETGQQYPFAAHCRATCRFDEQKLLLAMNVHSPSARIEKVSEESSEDVPSSEGNPQGRWFGRINPFNVGAVLSDLLSKEVRDSDIVQIIDTSLHWSGGSPDTVMSNAGDRRVAFEIHAHSLEGMVRQFYPDVRVIDVTGPCPIWLGMEGQYPKDYWLQFPPPQGPKIGILTGNSPESGLALWNDILASFRKMFKHIPDTLMPEFQVYSLPQMGLSMDLKARYGDVQESVMRAVRSLLESECKLITFACNTTIHFEPEVTTLCRAYGAEFVSIADASIRGVRRELNKGNSSGIGLVGIGPVVDMEDCLSGYKTRFEQEKLTVSPCPADELAFALKSSGDARSLVTEFRKLLKSKLPDKDIVVIALTELSLIYRQHVLNTPPGKGGSKVFIDPLLELADLIMLRYLEIGFVSSQVCQIPVSIDIASELAERHAKNSPQVGSNKS